MKKWSDILACLLLSAGIWLVMNLSRSNSDLERVLVTAVSNIEGHSEKSVEPVEITARCKASGFKLIKLHLSKKVKEIRFSQDDFKALGKGAFSISSSNLVRYIPDIFGNGVQVEAFVFQEFKFKFARERYKKVPVCAVQYVTFRPQHMPAAPIRFSPDSVDVYGPRQMLDAIDRIETKPITLKNLKSTAHGMTDLEQPPGVRLSTNEVSFELEVARYVEIKEMIPVNTVNVPGNSSLAVFPSSVEVTYKCAFPILADPLGTARCEVDYHDFENSISGRCMVRARCYTEGIIDIDVYPEACDCVETDRL